MEKTKTENLHKIFDKAQIVGTYNEILKASEAFSSLSTNIPKSFLEITQRIHGRFDSALFHVYKASNIFDLEEKIEDLTLSLEDLFFQYNSLDYLVRNKAITVGSANQVIDCLGIAYKNIKAWKKSCVINLKENLEKQKVGTDSKN